MLSLPAIETGFRRRARALTSPLARRFEASLWEAAFAEDGVRTVDDDRLLAAALWLGREVAAHDASRPPDFAGLGAVDAVVLGVASLNRQFHVLGLGAGEAGREAAAEGAVNFGHLSNVRVANGLGQRMSLGDFVEPGVEALHSWLHDAVRLGRRREDVVEEASDLSDRLVTFYSLRRVLKGLFDKALHLGHYLGEGREVGWQPHDRAFADLSGAWLARSEANFVSAPLLLRRAWPRLSPAQRRRRGLRRSVVAARVSSGEVGLVVGELSYLSRRPTRRALERAGLEASHLEIFLERPMPLAPLLTPALLLDSWCVIADAAEAMWEAVPWSATLAPLEARLHACAMRRSTIEGALADSLGIAPEVAEQVVDFLLFAEAEGSRPRPRRGRRATGGGRDPWMQGHRGLWSAPLVPVPGEDTILLPRAVFETSSTLFRMEAWLEKGGIDDTEIEHRGDVYETSIRARLALAMKGNQALAGARIATSGVPRTVDFGEQIDLLVRLGSSLIVGEVKFLLTPADPHQWHRYFAKLEDAATQATGKAAAIAARPDVAAAALNIGVDEAAALDVVPIVVVNNGAGFSLDIAGCRVVDADFLVSYMKGPLLATAGVGGPDGRMAELTTVLYRDEGEAGRRFDRWMDRPPLLASLIDRTQWDAVPYPRPTGGSFVIWSPFRGDLTPTERARYADAVDRLR